MESIYLRKHLKRARRKELAAFYVRLNSPEYIANQFTRYAFNEMNLFDVVPVLEELSFDDILDVAIQFFAENRMTICQVVPKK